MGYVHDTGMTMRTEPNQVVTTVGTWAMAVSAHLWTLNKTAAADTSVVRIPLRLPGNSAQLKGALLRSIDVWYSVATADINDATVEVYKASLPATGGTHSTTLLNASYDSGHDTTAKRKAQSAHRMTVTLSSAVWVTADDDVYLELTINAAATSVVKFLGARANYTMRM